ncbi:MAG: LEA type 2 family protein [Rhodospirillales bacterium]|nr:MAG: LEA type 2 family protein [Rhodospirillales bacterium]
MPRLLALSVLLVSYFLLGACVTPQSVEPPGIALQNVRLLEARGLVQMVRIDLLVSNPNDFDIPLTGLDFDMTVNGKNFAQGRSAAAVTLPRRGQASVPVDIGVEMLAVLRQLQAVQRLGKLDYRLSGTASLDHMLLPRVSFDRTGTLSLRRDGGGRRLQALES